jgi:hypothetical protein
LNKRTAPPVLFQPSYDAVFLASTSAVGHEGAREKEMSREEVAFGREKTAGTWIVNVKNA